MAFVAVHLHAAAAAQTGGQVVVRHGPIVSMFDVLAIPVAEDQTHVIGYFQRRGHLLACGRLGVHVEANELLAEHVLRILADLAAANDFPPAVLAAADEDGQRFVLLARAFQGRCVVLHPHRPHHAFLAATGVAHSGRLDPLLAVLLADSAGHGPVLLAAAAD